eukprot:scaffold14008_cov434-Alexandrium_tamarense.AAC.1
MTGRPYSSTNATAASVVVRGSDVPGTTETSALMASSRALVLSPKVTKFCHNRESSKEMAVSIVC